MAGKNLVQQARQATTRARQQAAQAEASNRDILRKQAEQKLSAQIEEQITGIPNLVKMAAKQGSNSVRLPSILPDCYPFWYGSPARTRLQSWAESEGLTLHERNFDS